MSRDTTHCSTTRAALVWVAVVTAAAGVLGLSSPNLRLAWHALGNDTWRHASLDTLIVWLASLVAVLSVAWLAGVCTVVVVQAVRGGGDRGVPGCPRFVQRAVLAACGVSLAAGLAGPSYAVGNSGADLPASHAVAGATSDDHVLDGLPLPDRAEGGRPTAAPVTTTMVVQPGDSLWTLAASTLAPDSTDVEIATRVRLLHRFNADVVGSDPDLILPSTVLRLPHP